MVSFQANVAEDVRPGDGVRAAHKVRVCDGAEGLAYFGGVGDETVRGDQEGSDAGCVGGVSEGAVQRA